MSLHTKTDCQRLLLDYLTYIRLGLNFSEATLRSYRYCLQLFADWVAQRDVTELSLQEVDEYFIKQRSNLKPTSLNTERARLRSFLQYIDRYRQIRLAFDPAMLRNIKTDETETRYLEPQLVYEIIRSLNHPQDKVIIFTMFATGMRLGEIVTLRVEDFRGSEMTIRGKGGKRRVVPLLPELETVLRDYISEHGLLTGTLFQHAMPKESLGPRGYSCSGLRKRLERHLEEAGYGHINPHMFRHSAATALLHGGMDVRSVQTFLGHSHIQTTMKYLHVTDQHLKVDYLAAFPRSS